MQDAVDFLLNLNMPLYWMITIIFILSVIHPMISQPWSLLSVTVASIWFGIPLALVILWSGYLTGMVIYYILIKKIDQTYHFEKHEKFIKARNWLRETPSFQHAISLGTPLVPTYLIKMMMPLSEPSFKRYMMVMIGTYVILTTSNVLLYYGIFVEAILGENSWITFIILFMFIMMMYYLSHQNRKKKQVQPS